jgi:NhaP-type Na+/H+ or K+/H+ antiporter
MLAFLQELSVITLLSYLSYLLADVTGLSAILSLFVCGVVVSHYALNNISEEGRVATMTGFRTAAYLAEGIIFIYVGMDALDPLKWQVSMVGTAQQGQLQLFSAPCIVTLTATQYCSNRQGRTD